MPDSVLVSVAGDVASAGAALAGLVLVFLGHTAGTFENYNPKDRPKVKDRFQKRGLLAFTGFLASLLACLLALIGKWQSHDATILAAIAFLIAAFVIVIFVALHTLMGLR
jgi:putative flippase GtrA